MDNNIMCPYRLAIKRGRKEKGLTQKQLSEALGVTPGHISHVEVGTEAVTLRLYYAIMYVLDNWDTINDKE